MRAGSFLVVTLVVWVARRQRLTLLIIAKTHPLDYRMGLEAALGSRVRPEKNRTEEACVSSVGKQGRPWLVAGLYHKELATA